MKSSTVNHVEGLNAFLRRWESHAEALFPARSEPRPQTTSASDPDWNSPLLTRWHPDFEASLDPGIEELVIALIDALDCVTYSSCEGHCVDGRAQERHVGIVPRDEVEREVYRQILTALCQSANDTSFEYAVRIQIEDTVLTNEGSPVAVLDLVIKGGDLGVKDYFAGAERLQGAFVRVLRRLRDATTNVSQ